MRTAVFPGSFDPVTLGHVDVARRAATLFDRLVVAILINPDKQSNFTVEERIGMFRQALPDQPAIRYEGFSGLLADFVLAQGACAIVRGLRGAHDLEYETPMAWANYRLTGGAETILLPSMPEHTAISSSLVRQIAQFGGDISPYVPQAAVDLISRRFYNMGKGSTEGGKEHAKE